MRQHPEEVRRQVRMTQCVISSYHEGSCWYMTQHLTINPVIIISSSRPELRLIIFVKAALMIFVREFQRTPPPAVIARQNRQSPISHLPSNLPPVQRFNLFLIDVYCQEALI